MAIFKTMDSSSKLDSLHTLYTDVSRKLAFEMLKKIPDHVVLTTCRKRLAELDKNIRRIQMQRDMWG